MLTMIVASFEQTPEPEVMYDLDVWDKLLILACAAMFLAMVICCMVCSLSPVCWIYHFCPFNDTVKPRGKLIQQWQ